MTCFVVFSLPVTPAQRNPRELFPVRDDFIRSAWVRRARAVRAQEYEELYPYFFNRSPLAGPRDTTTATAAAADAAAAIPHTVPEATAAATPRQRHHQRHRGPGVSAIEDSSEETAAPAPAVATPAPAATLPAESRGDNEGRTRGQRQQHMGISTGPRKVAGFRRAFRRLEPENMFRAPRVDGEPIWAYWGGGRGEGADHGHGRGQGQPPLPPGKRASTKDGFVLVPARDLRELRALEGALRKERGVLKAHCLNILNEGEVCMCVRVHACGMRACCVVFVVEMSRASFAHRRRASIFGSEVMDVPCLSNGGPARQ